MSKLPPTDQFDIDPGLSQSALSPLGKVRRAPELAARVAGRQIALLLELGDTSRFPIFGAIILVGLAFYPAAPLWTIAIPLALQTAAEICFHLVHTGFKSDPDADVRAFVWAKRYTLVTFVSGSTWAAAALLWLPGSTHAQQMFFMLVLACLSMATAIMRANYPPAAFTYVATICTPGFALLILSGNPLATATLGLGVVLLLTLTGWTRRLNRNYEEAFRLRFQNEELAERMGRAHAATEQKRHDAEQAEARARSALRSKSAFLGLLGKEIGIPLDALIRMAQDIRADPLSKSQRSLAEAIEGTGQTLKRQFDDMLDFSQMESHALELVRTAFDPGELVRGVARIMRAQAKQQGLSLELDISPSLPPRIVGDPDRLRQVLFSLISNAVKFTMTGGIILRVQLVLSGNAPAALRFSVLDTGIGMTPETQESLFEGFTQGEAIHAGPPDGMGPGLGLGLAISQRLIRLMGGEMRVDSAPGQGSTFWFLLPVDSGVKFAQEEKSGPSGLTNAADDPLVDHDYLYELERKLGTEGITDHIVKALDAILSLHNFIQSAAANRDPHLLKAGSDELRRAASDIGLPALSTLAAAIVDAVDQERSEDAIQSVPKLQQKITATWRALGKAFPALGQ